MNNVYFGLNNVAEKPSKIYVGDSNGVARKVKKAYLGVNGVAKQVYSSNNGSINDWNYTISGNYVYLNYYLGEEQDADVVIHSSYTINGVTYQTKISNSPNTYNQSGSLYMFNILYGHQTLIKTITIEQGVDTSECVSMATMFLGCVNAEIYGLEYFDTSNTEDFSSMFDSVKKLDGVENWDTSKGKYFSDMFANNHSRTNIQEEYDLTGWDTSEAINTNGMFIYRSNLQHIYVGSGWNMNNVTQSTEMFLNCTLLPNFNASYTNKTKAYVGNDGYLERTISTNDWDYTLSGNDIILNYWKYNNTTADDIVVYSTYTVNGQTYNTKISDIPPSYKTVSSINDLPPYMFGRYSNEQRGKQWLNSITFEQGVDTSDCTDISFMFCASNANIYGLEYLDVSNVETMWSVFRDLGYQKYIDGIKNWNTSKVKEFNGVLWNVRNTTIDISGWNTSSATSMSSMFRCGYSVPYTEHIYVGSGWNTSGVTQSIYMFDGQTLLPNFNSNYTDKTRAYVGSGGYLERKS